MPLDTTYRDDVAVFYDELDERVSAIQRVNDSIYLDVFESPEAVRNEEDPEFSVMVSRSDFLAGLSHLGLI